MSRDTSNNRRYSEEEFALILRKASELQEASGGSPGPGEGPGLTLDEMRSIAREAGIDPEAVSRAASLLGSLGWAEKKGVAAAIFGGPSKYHFDFEIDGRLGPEAYGRILELIRRTMEHQGDVSEVLGGLEWKTVGELSAISVNISPRDETTSIQIVGDRGGAGALTFTLPMTGSAILVGALGGILQPESAAAIIGLVGGLLGGGFLFARTLFVSQGRRFQRRLNALMEALTGGVERAALPSGSPKPGSDEPGDER